MQPALSSQESGVVIDRLVIDRVVIDRVVIDRVVTDRVVTDAGEELESGRSQHY